MKFRGLINAITPCDGTNMGPEPKVWRYFDPSAEGEGATLKSQRRLTGTDIIRLAHEFESLMQREFLLGSPRVDLLLTLIQFNILRALLINTKSLGWDFEWLECGEPISPWNRSFGKVERPCPPSLQPTQAQRNITHHPWIDLWPIPKMRDNLLLAEGLYDEDDLCNALVEFQDISNDQSGLVVWGEPWDPACWEVSETFARNWGWTINGCTELWESTNRWRAKRGEELLCWRPDAAIQPSSEG